MRNLYLRIFLSFWTAMVLVLTLTVVVTLGLTNERLQRLQARQDELAREASTVLAAQGVDGLQDWLRGQLREIPRDDRLYILDRRGEDLLGRPVPEFLQVQAGRRPSPDRPHPPLRPRGPRGPRGPRPAGPPEGPTTPQVAANVAFHELRLLSQLISPTTNQIYSLSLIHRWNLFGVFGSTETPIVALMATLLASTLMCFLLARYLSDPVRHLRAATRSIADGDLRVRVSGLLGRRRDELALLAVDFDAMAERLRNLLESQQQLLRDVSHELRSPLARLQIALGLARRPQANLAQELDRIEQETQRLDELIGEILSLSRLEDPARELVAEPVNLEELIDSLVDNARLEAEPRWVRVEFQVPAALVIAGDRELLFRAVENVVRNAVNYSPHGGLVTVAIAAQRDTVLIRVTDQGPGVPPELLERIFEPFFRVGKARDRASGGYGIGLAITARVVALHHGQVRAHDIPGGGLQVDITLPIHQPPQPSLTAATPTGTRDALNAPRGSGAGSATPVRA